MHLGLHHRGEYRRATDARRHSSLSSGFAPSLPASTQRIGGTAVELAKRAAALRLVSHRRRRRSSLASALAYENLVQYVESLPGCLRAEGIAGPALDAPEPPTNAAGQLRGGANGTEP